MNARSYSGNTLLMYFIVSGTWLFGQGLTFKGQFWTSVTAGDDPAPGHSDVELIVGYGFGGGIQFWCFI
jgi:hypothetical protein